MIIMKNLIKNNILNYVYEDFLRNFHHENKFSIPNSVKSTHEDYLFFLIKNYNRFNTIENNFDLLFDIITTGIDDINKVFEIDYQNLLFKQTTFLNQSIKYCNYFAVDNIIRKCGKDVINKTLDNNTYIQIAAKHIYNSLIPDEPYKVYLLFYEASNRTYEYHYMVEKYMCDKKIKEL